MPENDWAENLISAINSSAQIRLSRMVLFDFSYEMWEIWFFEEP